MNEITNYEDGMFFFVISIFKNGPKMSLFRFQKVTKNNRIELNQIWKKINHRWDVFDQSIVIFFHLKI